MLLEDCNIQNKALKIQKIQMQSNVKQTYIVKNPRNRQLRNI